ncbi:uncharacterized protein LOC135470326 [Liolophura sinensis]|uniref:uncharacterized protein LOC135470326 n=1 Tax=Liolophura sinensis TaxID=3198878 RepID=UPI003158288B
MCQCSRYMMYALRENSTRCTSVFLLLLLTLVSLTHQQTPSMTRGHDICNLYRITCSLPRNPCAIIGKKCISVETNTDQNSNKTCKYICKPQKPVAKTPFSNTQENISANSSVPFNESNNVSSPFTTTAPDWKSDPAYCERNFFCKNGGRCLRKKRENQTDILACQCPKEFKGSLCHWKCTKKCQNNGSCIFHEDSEKCQCLRNYTGQECEMKVQVKEPDKPEIWYIPVLIAFAALIFCVLVIFIVQKLRWRSLLVTKMFHFFQPYEDHDGKLFDAFISFRSNKADYTQSEDEKFVVRVLQPMLEKEYQYKVCVHYRDFPPGDTIANNIMWAVENSRRTIMILSPLYVGSNWTRLEYQKALQEMLQLRHKIIPVIFDDISDTHIEDPTLKHILSSVTYITYPSASDEREHNKFWQMLQMALPKKRSCEEETSSTSSHPQLALSSSQTLVSQESWQSGRTDVTDISEDIEMEEVPCNDHVSVNVNELDKIRVTSAIETPNKKQLTLNNNADKFISILEGVS